MDSIDFVLDQGGFFIGDAEDCRARGGALVRTVAQRENGCAGGVGNVVQVDQKFVAGVKSVERKVVEVSVRNDDQISRVNVIGHRSDQFVVEFGEVADGGIVHFFCGAVTKVRLELDAAELETEKTERFGNFG